MRRHIAVPRRPLGPVGWHGDRMSTNVLSGVLRRGQQSTWAERVNQTYRGHHGNNGQTVIIKETRWLPSTVIKLL